MSDFKLTREEQETLLRISAADREWDFFTLDPKFVRRLGKLGWELEKDHQGGWSCRFPLNRITIRRREKRKLTEAQRRTLARQANKLNSRRQIDKIEDQKSLAIVGQGKEGSDEIY